ncbi:MULTISPECIES: hypothetical protein [Pseudomonas]|uniref:Uncharacterized protein n=2 Tax=Pseudomonas TaxID=286 RepID=A0AAU8LMK2_PSESX|nr:MULTISPECIES: hypothetical protein [Pseudomonas]MBC3957885.1 hypothetical protein [Pseudomonas triticifolii]
MFKQTPRLVGAFACPGYCFLAANDDKELFSEVAKDNLPERFPLMAVDSTFYVLALSD